MEGKANLEFMTTDMIKHKILFSTFIFQIFCAKTIFFLLIIIIARLTPVYKDYASRAMFISSIENMLTGKSGLKFRTFLLLILIILKKLTISIPYKK